MKNIVFILVAIFTITSCNNSNSKSQKILPLSVGKTNSVLTVLKTDLWNGKLGDEIRQVFGEHQYGLPQPETLISMSQIDPSGFSGFMRNNRAVLNFKIGGQENISIEKNKHAEPQIIITVTGKDEQDLLQIIKKRGEEIIGKFKNQDVYFSQLVFRKDRLDEQKYKTIRDLGIELTIPKSFRLVKDSIGFLWLRQHLTSGIARGAGSNNILVYTLPLNKQELATEDIVLNRDMIGQKHIPGSKEGMFMITERIDEPRTINLEISGRKAYETRGKWEVKNDFMAGPFVNYTVVDKANNRLLIFEGFTYAPSANKRDLLFELEAIGKSLKIK